MTSRHPPPAATPEPLTPDERAWAERLARIGPHDGPPVALDTRILEAAHAAVAQRPHRQAWRRRWPALVGAAASLVIVVGLAWQWQLQPLLRSRPSLGEAPPAVAPIARSEGSQSADVLAVASPVAPTAVDNPPPPPMPAVASAPRRPHAPPPPPAVTDVPAAPPAPPSAAEFGDDAIPPYADYAGMAAARQAAAKTAANDVRERGSMDERRERATSASPQPFPAARADAADAEAMPAPAPAAAPATRAQRAFAPARDASSREATAAPPQAERDNAALDHVEASGSRIPLAELPVRDDVRLEPAAWLQRIRDRRDADNLDGARESLALFRERHPRIHLPDDLARLDR